MRYILDAGVLQANLLNRTLVIPSFVYARGCQYNMYAVICLANRGLYLSFSFLYAARFVQTIRPWSTKAMPSAGMSGASFPTSSKWGSASPSRSCSIFLVFVDSIPSSPPRNTSAYTARIRQPSRAVVSGPATGIFPTPIFSSRTRQKCHHSSSLRINGTTPRELIA